MVKGNGRIERLSRDEIVKELRSRGAHTTDISDAFYEADPDWLSY